MGPLKDALVISTLCAFTVMSSGAQQPAPLSKRALLVKQKAARLAAGDKISVVRTHTHEEYGTFKFAGPDGFTFHDVDEKLDVTLRYAEIKKIKDGYGGYNSISGRHTDRTKALIVVGITAGVLIGLLVAVAGARN